MKLSAAISALAMTVQPTPPPEPSSRDQISRQAILAFEHYPVIGDARAAMPVAPLAASR